MLLKEKIVLLEENMRTRHLIDGGLVGSVLTVDQNGNPVDPDDPIFAHAVTWTGVYISALAYHYAATGDPSVRRHADDVLRCMTNCIYITGTPGVLCRGYVNKNGLTQEERHGGLTDKLVYAGQGEFAGKRYICSPSHHNHDHYIRGLTTYYLLAADDAQKALIKRNLSVLGRRVYLDGGMVATLPNGDKSASLVYISNSIPNDCLTMAMTNAKMLAYVTGERAYQELYEHLCERVGAKKLKTEEALLDNLLGRIRSKGTGHDDGEHIVADLFVMSLIEDDPDMREFYRAYTALQYRWFRDDLHSPFNFIESRLLGTDCGIAAGVETLRLYSTDRMYQPRLNTPQFGFSDGLTVREHSPKAVPMDRRPIDNELEWKGDPYRPDGWLARPVRKVVPVAECPDILNVLEQNGALYRSEDGGRSFHAMPVPSGLRDIVYAGRTMRVALAATAEGLFRSFTGGMSWTKIPGVGAAHRIYASPCSPDVFYAVADNGIWKCADDEGSFNTLALRWRVAEDDIPGPASGVTVAFSGGRTVFSVCSDGRVYHKAEGEGKWSQFRIFHSFSPADVSLPSPDPWRGDTWFGKKSYGTSRIFRFSPADEAPVMLGTPEISPDGWSAGSGLTEHNVVCFTPDPAAPGRIIAGCHDGLFAADDGENFTKLDIAGIDIPYIYSISLISDTLFFSTPSGLYRLRSGAREAERLLCLNGDGLNRAECAPTDFIYAYWMGRYFGYIGEND